MARGSACVRVAATVAVAAALAALAACSAAPASSPLAVASPVASPVATPSRTASPSLAPAATAATTELPAPSKSARPRPSIDQADLDAFLTSSITLLDLADADLAVTVAYIDPDSDEAIDVGTYTVGFTEQQTNQVPPGKYRLEFRKPADVAKGPTCTIELADGEAYTFAAIDGGVAVSRAGDSPADARELFVGTSSLCVT